MKPKPIEVPKLKDVSSEIGEIENRRDAIAALITKKEAERAALIAAHDESAANGANALDRAAVLLGEAPAKVAPDRKKRLVELAGEIRDLRAAIDLLNAQWRQAKSRASAIVRARVEPEYRRRVQALCAALIDAHRANTELKALTDSLEANEVEWSGLGVVSNHTLGHPRDRYSHLAMDLRDAARLGLFEKREIPLELVE